MIISPDSQRTASQGILRIGALKVKKSYLVINESISTILGRTNPREFREVNFDVEPRCISISNPETSVVEERHSVPWILYLGIYNKDSRYFGYVVSEAAQGSKTKMYCYVYRCACVFQAKSILESIRSVWQNINTLASQASTSPRYVLSPPQKSSSGTLKRFGSLIGLDKSHNDAPQKSVDGNQKNANSKAGNEQIHQDQPIKPQGGNLKRFGSKHGLEKTQQEAQNKEDAEVPDAKKTPKSRQRLFTGSLIKRKISKESQSTFRSYTIDIGDTPSESEMKDTNFTVSYLCSTIVNPPLRAKHIRECFKQYQKEISKCTQNGGKAPPANILQLHLSPKTGVEMFDPKTFGTFRREFPLQSLDRFVVHPENVDCFAFSTVVSGNSKHKCHLFTKVKETTKDIRDSFECLLMQRVC